MGIFFLLETCTCINLLFEIEEVTGGGIWGGGRGEKNSCMMKEFVCGERSKIR